MTSSAKAPDWTSASVAALIVANLIPLAGVLLLHWDVGQVMVLFWAENGIVGFYALLRLARVAGLSAVVLCPFFVVHFGAFMAGHFLFLYVFFIQGIGPGASADLPSVQAATHLLAPLWPALLALFLSHGVSFYTNFVRKREFEGRNPSDVMMQPYKRVVILHLTIIVGGGLVLVTGRPTWALVLLLALKTAMDLRAHRTEHQDRGRTELETEEAG